MSIIVKVLRSVEDNKSSEQGGVNIELRGDDAEAIRSLITDNYNTLDRLATNEQQRESLFKLVSSLEMIYKVNNK